MSYQVICFVAAILGLLGMAVVFYTGYRQITVAEAKSRAKAMEKHDSCRCGLIKLKTEKKCNHCISVEAGMQVSIAGNCKVERIGKNGYVLVDLY